MLEPVARIALETVQMELGHVLIALRSRDRGPRELARRLAIHPTLAWKMLRIVQSRDLFADSQYLPGAEGLATFLAAAADRGVPAATITATRNAFQGVQRLIDEHAGDRTTLEQMLSALSNDARVQSDSRPFRKAGFRCASSTWGMQIRVRVLSKILRPSETEPLMDIALIRAFVGMRRIRPGAPIPLARVVVLDNDGKSRREARPRPIDPEGVCAGVPLLRAFCSDPLPEIRIAPGPDGGPEQQLAEAPIGESAAATVFSGEVQMAAASRVRDAHNRVSNTAVSVRTPIESLVIDLWAHRDLFKDQTPIGMLYGEACGVAWYKQSPASAERLPLAEIVRTIGPGLARARLTDVPEYVDVMRYAFETLRWNAEEFTLHRLRVDYPVIATAVVMQVPLPDAE